MCNTAIICNRPYKSITLPLGAAIYTSSLYLWGYIPQALVVGLFNKAPTALIRLATRITMTLGRGIHVVGAIAFIAALHQIVIRFSLQHKLQKEFLCVFHLKESEARIEALNTLLESLVAQLSIDDIRTMLEGVYYEDPTTHHLKPLENCVGEALKMLLSPEFLKKGDLQNHLALLKWFVSGNKKGVKIAGWVGSTHLEKYVLALMHIEGHDQTVAELLTLVTDYTFTAPCVSSCTTAADRANHYINQSHNGSTLASKALSTVCAHLNISQQVLPQNSEKDQVNALTQRTPEPLPSLPGIDELNFPQIPYYVCEGDETRVDVLRRLRENAEQFTLEQLISNIKSLYPQEKDDSKSALGEFLKTHMIDWNFTTDIDYQRLLSFALALISLGATPPEIGSWTSDPGLVKIFQIFALYPDTNEVLSWLTGLSFRDINLQEPPHNPLKARFAFALEIMKKNTERTPEKVSATEVCVHLLAHFLEKTDQLVNYWRSMKSPDAGTYMVQHILEKTTDLQTEEKLKNPYFKTLRILFCDQHTLSDYLKTQIAKNPNEMISDLNRLINQNCAQDIWSYLVEKGKVNLPIRAPIPTEYEAQANEIVQKVSQIVRNFAFPVQQSEELLILEKFLISLFELQEYRALRGFP